MEGIVLTRPAVLGIANTAAAREGTVLIRPAAADIVLTTPARVTAAREYEWGVRYRVMGGMYGVCWCWWRQWDMA